MGISFTIPKAVSDLLSLLNEHGYQSYLVGGSIRDMIMGKKPVDYDIVTNAETNAIIKLLNDHRFIGTGLKHGTLTVIYNGLLVEITTFRNAKDNTLKGDLAKRDFTINAMAYHPDEGLIDLYDGLNDIKAKVITAVVNPEDRFLEDPLRILRALRFSSTLGFLIDEVTTQAIHMHKSLLKQVAMERFNHEFGQILYGGSFMEVMATFKDVISEIFQLDIDNAIDYDKSLLVMKEMPPIVSMRLAGLFSTIANDHDSLYQVKKELERLKFDNKTVKSVITLLEHKDKTIVLNVPDIKQCMRKLGTKETIDFIILKTAIALVEGNLTEQLKLQQLKMLVDEIITKRQPFSIKDLKVSGDDLLAIGYKPGKQIGNVLDHLLNEVISSDLENDFDCLIERALVLQENNDE